MIPVVVKEALFGSDCWQLVVVVQGTSGCSILGIVKVTLPPTLLEATVVLLLVVVVVVVAVDAAVTVVAADALFLPFLATENTLVDLSAFLWCFL